MWDQIHGRTVFRSPSHAFLDPLGSVIHCLLCPIPLLKCFLFAEKQIVTAVNITIHSKWQVQLAQTEGILEKWKLNSKGTHDINQETSVHFTVVIAIGYLNLLKFGVKKFFPVLLLHQIINAIIIQNDMPITN